MSRKLFFFVAICLLNFAFGAKYNHAPKVEGDIAEKKIVVLVPSYNNEQWYKKNLDSIFMQKYSNFRVIYTSDASTDNTAQLVLDYVEKCGWSDRFTFIDNKVNKKPLYNLYKMTHSCSDDEITVTVDGDDWLLHDKVLDRVNRAYADDRVWMTYGTDKNLKWNWPFSYPTLVSDLQNGTYRRLNWAWSHLRTYYAGLFKQVPVERWKRDGEFYDSSGDVAIILYLLDLAREHVFFIDELLYLYNTDNPLNEHKVNREHQLSHGAYIWKQPPLKRLYSKTDFIKEIYE